MTSADSQPWHVRCPETKSSSYGTSFTPLICGRAACVGASAMFIRLLLLPDADPVAHVALVERSLGGRRLRLLEDLGGHGLIDLASAEAGDEADDDGTPVQRVQRGAHFVVEHAAVVRRPEAVVAIDDAHGIEAREALHDLRRREGTEPLEPDEADLVALRAEAADRDLHREGERALTEEDELRVIGHVLVE